MDLIELDGSHGEGGGQLLRTALSLSVLLRKPFRITNIRAKRPSPGLRAQHLACVQALAELSNAEVEGAELHSIEFCFTPLELKAGGVFKFDIKTAGSTLLLLQALLPPLVFARSKTVLELQGGTCARFAPPQLYLQRVFLPAVAKMGLRAEINVEKWGWFPKGGGILKAEVQRASQLTAFDCNARRALRSIDCIAASSNLPVHVAQRMSATASKSLSSFAVPVKTETVDAPSLGVGAMFFVQANYENSCAGFTSIGEIGVPAEKVALDSCNAFTAFNASGAAVDERLSDQIALYCALAKGRSVFSTPRLSNHLQSNLWVIQQFLPVHFEVEEKNGVFQLSVDGTGFGSK
ncbi:TPA: RNA 3'-phosphate cyclase [Candidatus Micrarchaeota archaeon]|nr:MAG: RNA 3'-terminal-phosphate cyclase [Candidatus Micrarchaeota archaeon CG1_02_51_15]HII38382.1 RNA 3'-phosphate cyclase [Candidatus Micrarchaeota archaeon]